MATPEGQIQKSIIDYCALKGHWCLRHATQGQFDQKMNQGYGGYRKSTATLGEADLQVFPKDKTAPVWVEVKTKTGKLSANQILFKKLAESWGHVYIVARSIDDLQTIGL